VSHSLPLRLCARFIHFHPAFFSSFTSKPFCTPGIWFQHQHNRHQIPCDCSEDSGQCTSSYSFAFTSGFFSFMSLPSSSSQALKSLQPCNEPLVSNSPLFRQQLGKKVVEILYILVCGICCTDSMKIFVPSRLAIWSLTYFSRAYLAMLDVVTLASGICAWSSSMIASNSSDCLFVSLTRTYYPFL